MLIGILGSIIDYSIMIALKEVLLIPVLIASGIAFTLTLIYTYYMDMKFVFTDLKEEITKKRIVMIFVITSILGLLFNQLIMYVLVKKIFLNYLISKLISVSIVGIWNFISKKFLIEKRTLVNAWKLEKFTKTCYNRYMFKWKKGCQNIEYNIQEFQYNIENIKQDLAVENMNVSENQIKILQEYEQGNILMSDIIKNVLDEYK